jgi:hypothetical protein
MTDPRQGDTARALSSLHNLTSTWLDTAKGLISADDPDSCVVPVDPRQSLASWPDGPSLGVVLCASSPSSNSTSTHTAHSNVSLPVRGIGAPRSITQAPTPPQENDIARPRTTRTARAQYVAPTHTNTDRRRSTGFGLYWGRKTKLATE